MDPMKEVREVTRECTDIFLALGDHHRQDILILLLTDGPLNVTEIANLTTNVSRPTISHHLRVLKNAGLVSVESKSRENFYSVEWEDAAEKLIKFMGTTLKDKI